MSEETQRDGSVITPALVEDLTAAAVAALTSSNRHERDAASDRLLFLSSFDNWESTTKQLLPFCENNYLRFIVCKAMHFMVANELGPQERMEMQCYVLRYVQDRRQHGEALPPYIQHELFLIYAAALFSHWKMAVISDQNAQMNARHSSEQTSDGVPLGGPGAQREPFGGAQASDEAAASIVREVTEYLQPAEALDCLREVLLYFSQHVAKAGIPSLRQNFANAILPYLFETAAQSLEQHLEKAAELCCTALECMVPLSSSGSLLNVKYTSEASIHILRWADGWSASLAVVLQVSSNYLCGYTGGEHARLMGRLLQLCSRVDSPHELFVRQGRELFSGRLLLVSSRLLKVCLENSSSGFVVSDLMLLAGELFVNTFERHKDCTVEYIQNNFPSSIQCWTEAAQRVLQSFAEDDDDLRRVLMHLFFLFAENLLPRRVQRREGARADPCDVAVYGDMPLPPARVSFSAGGEEIVNGHSSESSNAPVGPLGRENGQQLASLVATVFETYLDAVVERAHLREDSTELRFEAGVVLHNERTLQPLAEMLYCDKLDFQTGMMARLVAAISDFEICSGARESALRSSSGGASLPFADDTTAALLRITSSISPAQVESVVSSGGDGSCTGVVSAASGLSSLFSNPSALFANFGRSPLSLFLTRVCLSRLTVLVSIFGIAIQHNTIATNDEALVKICDFARSLLKDDDQLTNELLQTLSLFDFSLDDNSPAGESSAGSAGRAWQTTRDTGPSPPPSSSTMHMGIVRTLFFFCHGVLESHFDSRPEFIDVMLDLLRFVYLLHSDEAALVIDANVLFKRITSEGTTAVYLLSSDKLTALVQAVRDDSIPAFRLPPTVPQPLPPAARNGFFTALTCFVEARYYAGFSVGDVLSVVVERALSPGQRLAQFAVPSLEEVIAVTRGAQQVDTLLLVLNAAFTHRAVLLEDVMRREPESAACVVRWLSVLCVLAQSLLEADVTSTTQWELSSLVLGATVSYFGLISRSSPAHAAGVSGGGSSAADSVATKFFEFAVDAVEPAVVYDTAEMLHTLCTASWCNLGVISYYEASAVQRFFCGSVQLLLAVSPQLLMSAEEGKRKVFDAVVATLTREGPVFASLHLLLMRQNVWQHTLDHLTRCLQYQYMPEILHAMVLVVRHDKDGRDNIPNYNAIADRTLAAAFHETAVLVAVAPYLELRQLSYAFEVLQISFSHAKMLCTERIKQLLAFCSAYHRVRIRTIWSMLMNGEPEMLERYISVFGQSSKVATLSAW